MSLLGDTAAMQSDRHGDTGAGGRGSRLMGTHRDMEAGWGWHGAGGIQRHARRTGLYLRRRLHCKGQHAPCEQRQGLETTARDGSRMPSCHHATAHAMPAPSPGTTAVTNRDQRGGPLPLSPLAPWAPLGTAQLCPSARGATFGFSPWPRKLWGWCNSAGSEHSQCP